ncbi:hypothetical protein F7Q99_25000 [Streptomyces kaniharaensis]|uniref:Uncharacterized protein n=1 Tax=Streptomyces kaniharaensis TaxID=212423 RepID=A0A6N7KUY4_9ACTN|nr:hypothetical protein [Streptomyces kaniharaensis]MQS15436.1 hypothetical protein [Streptomyces kaniharaensis]
MADGQELVARVVDALRQTAAGGSPAAPGSVVADLVRTRLRAMPAGAQAVDAIEAGPADPKARAALTTVVAQLLTEDPAFAGYLLTTELGRPADPPTVHLRIGPPPTSARRTTGGILVTLALVVVASLVALGINLGSRPLLQPGVHGYAHAATALRDPGQAQGVLPDVQAMPSGWRIESGPHAGTGTTDDVPCVVRDTCDEQLAYATVTFRVGSRRSVQFTVLTFASPEAAGRAFDTMLGSTGGGDAPVTVPLPPIGDRSAARTRGSQGGEALVRVGTTLLHVHDSGPGATAADIPVLTAFARLLATRSQQAQDGRTPDAAAPSSLT